MVNQYGGSREGAGRKALYDEATKVIRIPESRIVEIKNYLANSKKAKFNDGQVFLSIDLSLHG
ncbi:hypothetical protein ACWPO0_18020 [Acinetobacter nosocomialis]